MHNDYANGNEFKTALNSAAQEDPLMCLMRAYVEAKREFDDACGSFAKASERKNIAENRLQELSGKVQATVQQGVYDPTMPQPSSPSCAPSNGMFSQNTPNLRY